MVQIPRYFFRVYDGMYGAMGAREEDDYGDYVCWDDVEPLLVKLEELRKFMEEYNCQKS